MEKTLYERSLEALVAERDGRVLWLEDQNARLEQRLRSALARLQPASEAPEPEPESLPFETVHRIARSTQPPEKSGALDANEKRAFLTRCGWTEHVEIYAQNIPVCWERGAKWYSLDDAYEIQKTEPREPRLAAE